MSMRYVIGVNKRIGDGVVQICMFEGEMLADQYILALYRAEWEASIRAGVGQAIGGTFDRWFADDYYSNTPLYFKTKHELWNQVPPSIHRIAGHYDGALFHDTRGADTETSGAERLP